jgi:hypothetical protein
MLAPSPTSLTGDRTETVLAEAGTVREATALLGR